MQYYHHLNPSSVTPLDFHPGTSRSSHKNDILLGLTTKGYAHIRYICDLSGTTTQGLVIVPCPPHQSGPSHSLIPMSCLKTISQVSNHMDSKNKNIMYQLTQRFPYIYIKIYIYIYLENHTVKVWNGTEFPQHQTTVQAGEGYKIPYFP